jgi:ATP-binding cassette subfamily B (MDR/TAP) protein 1
MAMPNERITEIDEMADIRLDDDRKPSTRQNASIGHSAEDALLVQDNQSDAERSTGTPWLSLFTFTTLSHFGVLALALIFTLISGLVVPGMSILLGKIFGSFAGLGSGFLEPQEFMAEVRRYSTYLAILGAMGWGFNCAFFATWIWFGESQAGTARKRIFDRLIEKELSWYEERKNGVLSLTTNCQT